MKEQRPTLPAPAITPELNAEFRPAVLASREFRNGLGRERIKVEVALERKLGDVSRHSMFVATNGHSLEAHNFLQVERWLKFLLWSRGGRRVYFAGPSNICSALQGHYRDSSTGRFDAEIMGKKVYDALFEIVPVAENELPARREITAALGKQWNGCRIGFDLGASDRKVAAVDNGKVLWTEEVPWNPRAEKDPQWHFDQIMDSLKRASNHLPRIDAIGGSSAGIYVENQVQVASLFRGVPEDAFESRVKKLFLDLRRAWGGIPFEVVNDGEVTALAGAMSLSDSAVLGLALGSSLAAGYVTPDGNITTWLNELAFAPIDYNPDAPRDEWSGDYGCGVQYLSQQAVGRLIPVAGLNVDRNLPLPEQLVAVQEAMNRGDAKAAAIYRTIGTYLGYAIAHYAGFYEFRHLLLLGRVTTGEGGTIIVRTAEEVLKREFPELAGKMKIHLPDEKEKRHGQAVAAASLPVIPV